MAFLGRRFRGFTAFPQCSHCSRSTHSEAYTPAIEGNYIPMEKVVLAMRLMVEGNSLRSTERITGLDINTLMKILVKAGEKCEALMGRLIVNVPVVDVQCDEIRAFVGKKEGHKLPTEENN